jgi:cell shape-determining protein MreC
MNIYRLTLVIVCLLTLSLSISCKRYASGNYRSYNSYSSSTDNEIQRLEREITPAYQNMLEEQRRHIEEQVRQEMYDQEQQRRRNQENPCLIVGRC